MELQIIRILTMEKTLRQPRPIMQYLFKQISFMLAMKWKAWNTVNILYKALYLVEIDFSAS